MASPDLINAAELVLLISTLVGVGGVYHRLGCLGERVRGLERRINRLETSSKGI